MSHGQLLKMKSAIRIDGLPSFFSEPSKIVHTLFGAILQIVNVEQFHD